MHTKTSEYRATLGISGLLKDKAFIKGMAGVALVMIIIAYQLIIGRQFHFGMGAAIIFCLAGVVVAIKDRQNITLVVCGIFATFLALNDPVQLIQSFH